jgi:predicted SAM-dependent methyltransferase/glycosyltransferase involved in cell wall biosynthesis
MDKMTSIIIPTLFGDQSLRDCIQSIQDYTDLSTVEIIIVANGCKLPVALYLSTLPVPCKYIWYDEALGFSKAVNIGIQESVGDYIVLLNDDCKLLPQRRNEWLERLKEPFKANITGVVGPHSLIDPITRKQFVPYYCVMFQRETLEIVGLLDETFFPGGCEDIDHCIRIQEAGRDIYSLLPFYLISTRDAKFVAGDFPIYHKGEHTVEAYFADKQNNWKSIFYNNQVHLKAKWVDKQVVTSIIPSLKGKHLTFPGNKKVIVGIDPASLTGDRGTIIEERIIEEGRLYIDAVDIIDKASLPSPLHLNLGCGDVLLPGYVNVDKYDSHADVDWDAIALPLERTSVDTIYSSHLIEHFDFHEGQTVLREWQRVLKEGGILIIETPDLLASCRKFVASNEQERINMYSHFFSTPWLEGQIHKFLYTPSQMRRTLEQLGFKQIHQERALRYIDREDICMKFVCKK